MNVPRRLSLHRSLTRPILLAGGERKLVILNYTVMAVLLLGAGLHVLTVVSAVLLATIAQMGLVQLAHYDPQWMQVYLRYRYYERFYAAQSNVFNHHHGVRPAILKGARP